VQRAMVQGAVWVLATVFMARQRLKFQTFWPFRIDFLKTVNYAEKYGVKGVFYGF
jgi:hypothetical protein